MAAAAYRSGLRLTDRTSGQSHDYSRRKGVAHAEIMVPPGSAPWLSERDRLWSTVEAMEQRKDAQLAREFNMALPYELSHDQRLALVRGFVNSEFVARGMVADLALHDPITDHDQNARNYHAHVMLTLRRATGSGLDPVKTREWNSKDLLQSWRAAWAAACNDALDRAGKRMRITHRTLAAQREEALSRHDLAQALVLNREPEIHVGPRARKALQQHRGEAGLRKGDDNDRSGRHPGARTVRLASILTRNDVRLKHDLQGMSRRFDRISRNLDHWERRTTFASEGLLPAFRRSRRKALANKTPRQRLDSPKAALLRRRRITQIRTLLKGLEMVIAAGTHRRESGLIRAREVAGWLRPARGRSKSRGRHSGRYRKASP